MRAGYRSNHEFGIVKVRAHARDERDIHKVSAIG